MAHSTRVLESRYHSDMRTRIRFLGAAQAVTGSMHLVETPSGSVLVDCGQFQGRRADAEDRNRRPPREAIAADAMVLTHAHIDHSGNIPSLVKRGFSGPIYATPATRDLAAHLLADSARIQEGDAAFLNRKQIDNPAWRPIEPLYDEDDATRALERFVGLPYRERRELLPGVFATLFDAGHILGSSGVLLEVGSGPSARRIALSGDIGRSGMPILRDPDPPLPPADYVLMESTYGNRAHDDIRSMHDALARVVTTTAARGGKIVVPAFAVGRTQELIFSLAVLRREGRIPDVPVFVDSPLAVNVTKVFKQHADCFDDETRAFLKEHGTVFDFPGLRYVESREESMRLNSLRGPAVIVSSSGMCEGGRVLHHLRNTIENPANTVLVVGYMAQHTLGRRIIERRPRVKIHGVERDLRAEVVVMNSFSAHADKHDLLAYARTSGRDAKAIFLVHGEPDQQEPLSREIARSGQRCVAPAPGAVEELQ